MSLLCDIAAFIAVNPLVSVVIIFVALAPIVLLNDFVFYLIRRNKVECNERQFQQEGSARKSDTEAADRG